MLSVRPSVPRAHTGACQIGSWGLQSAYLCYHRNAATIWTGIELGPTGIGLKSSKLPAYYRKLTCPSIRFCRGF